MNQGGAYRKVAYMAAFVALLFPGVAGFAGGHAAAPASRTIRVASCLGSQRS